jgi:circadian clock protein KaiC
MYLIMGNAGSGKTTLGLHFLMEGRARGERVLYISLSETVNEIEDIARSHGWTLEALLFRKSQQTRAGRMKAIRPS